MKFGLENNFKINHDNCTEGVNWSIDVTAENRALYTLPRSSFPLLLTEVPLIRSTQA